jgi:drug/metabolite transporter (DMT)-like permease
VNANLFGNAEMVFLILLAIFVLGERWTVGHAIASISIALGIFIVALRGFTEGISFRTGDILIILASLSFSLGSITFRKYLHHIEPQIAIFVRSLTAISVFLLLHGLALAAGSGEESALPVHSFLAEIRSFPLALLPALLGFCFIARFCNVLTFYVALDRLPVATVSLLGSLTVVTGTLFAHWYLDEPILWYHTFGGSLIILGGIILETLGLHPSEKHHTAHLEQKLHRA